MKKLGAVLTLFIIAVLCCAQTGTQVDLAKRVKDSLGMWSYANGEQIINNSLAATNGTAALAIGTPVGPPQTGGGLMMTGSAPIEVHSGTTPFITMFTHNNNGLGPPPVDQGAAPVIAMYQARGTQLVPTPTQSVDALGYFEFGGYTGTAYVPNIIIQATALDNWTPSVSSQDGVLNFIFSGATGIGKYFFTINADGNGTVAVLRTLSAGSVETDTVQIFPQTFSNLGTTCNSGVEGLQAAITDSTTNTWGATITGSGSFHVLAYCDGSNWTVAGK